MQLVESTKETRQGFSTAVCGWSTVVGIKFQWLIFQICCPCWLESRWIGVTFLFLLYNNLDRRPKFFSSRIYFKVIFFLLLRTNLENLS